MNTQYREVIPVAGEPVPPGCEWRFGDLDWSREDHTTFLDYDVSQYRLAGLRYRCPDTDPQLAALSPPPHKE